jgi:hypothetical protein
MESVIIPILSVFIAAGALSISGAMMMRTRKNDFAVMVEKQTEQAVLTKQIVEEYKDISKSIGSLSESYSLFVNRVIIIEESLRTAWKRIDELVQFTGLIERKENVRL